MLLWRLTQQYLGAQSLTTMDFTSSNMDNLLFPIAISGCIVR